MWSEATSWSSSFQATLTSPCISDIWDCPCLLFEIDCVVSQGFCRKVLVRQCFDAVRSPRAQPHSLQMGSPALLPGLPAPAPAACPGSPTGPLPMLFLLPRMFPLSLAPFDYSSSSGQGPPQPPQEVRFTFQGSPASLCTPPEDTRQVPVYG